MLKIYVATTTGTMLVSTYIHVCMYVCNLPCWKFKKYLYTFVRSNANGMYAECTQFCPNNNNKINIVCFIFNSVCPNFPSYMY